MATIAQNVNARIAKNKREQNACFREQFVKYFNNKKTEIIAISETAGTKTLILCGTFNDLCLSYCPKIWNEVANYMGVINAHGNRDGMSEYLFAFFKNDETVGPVFTKFEDWADNEGLKVSVEYSSDNIFLIVSVP